MSNQTSTGTCSVCDRKEVEVRHFETCAATGEGITICLECQPPKKGGDGPGFDGECFSCQSRSDDLDFCPIDGSDFGIYLCPTCHLGSPVTTERRRI